MPTLTALHPTGCAVRLEVASLDQVDAAITDLLRRGDRPATGGDGGARPPPPGRRRRTRRPARPPPRCPTWHRSSPPSRPPCRGAAAPRTCSSAAFR